MSQKPHTVSAQLLCQRFGPSKLADAFLLAAPFRLRRSRRRLPVTSIGAQPVKASSFCRHLLNHHPDHRCLLASATTVGGPDSFFPVSPVWKCSHSFRT